MKEIQLTQGKVALVDDEDYNFLCVYSWHAHKGRETYYATTNINKKTVKMHRLLLNAKDDDFIDHKDHNELNNQRNNIRICTRSQNKQNALKRKAGSSAYKEVNWHKHEKRWVAQVSVNKVRLHLGYYDSEDLAALMYNFGAIKYFGKFACLNILPEEYSKLFEDTNKILKLNGDMTYALHAD